MSKGPPSHHHLSNVPLLMIAFQSDSHFRNRMPTRKLIRGYQHCVHDPQTRLRQLEANGYHEVHMFLVYENQPSLAPPPHTPLSSFSVACSFVSCFNWTDLPAPELPNWRYPTTEVVTSSKFCWSGYIRPLCPSVPRCSPCPAPGLLPVFSTTSSARATTSAVPSFVISFDLWSSCLKTSSPPPSCPQSTVHSLRSPSLSRSYASLR